VSKRTRLCAISVDLDEIRHYCAIYGLRGEAGAAHAVYDRAIGRFADFAAGEGLPLTFFVVGADLERADNGARLRALVERGHELGNHTFDHHYDLTRRSDAEIEAQIARANQALAAHAGVQPTGFRAPGYTMSASVYRALAANDMVYSSSVFPCPYYYATKVAVIAGLSLLGKRSSSIVSSPAVIAAPRVPHRVAHGEGAGMLELPIQVTPGWRLPFIGSVLSLLGTRVARRLARSLIGEELINLELHGVDLLDRHDGLEALAPHQADLRVPLATKWNTLSVVVAELRRGGYAFVRLDQAAREISARA
jgi:peptidoglycan/xylan/chitin deacetylase (PgdA/CDA1 family)